MVKRERGLHTMDSSEFRQVMGLFCTGVTVITIPFEGAVHGMTANSFTFWRKGLRGSPADCGRVMTEATTRCMWDSSKPWITRREAPCFTIEVVTCAASRVVD